MGDFCFSSFIMQQLAEAPSDANSPKVVTLERILGQIPSQTVQSNFQSKAQSHCLLGLTAGNGVSSLGESCRIL